MTPFDLLDPPFSLILYEANVYLDFQNWSPFGACASEAWIPFLSLGAMEDRGNNGPIAEIRWPPLSGLRDQVSFRVAANALAPSASQFYQLGFYVIAQWPSNELASLPRMLFIILSTKNGLPTSSGLWNWPISESMFWPGADVAVMTRPDAATICGQYFPDPVAGAGHQNITASLSDLFHCASDLGLFEDPMPGNQIHKVTGFHWFIESERRPELSPSNQPSLSMHLRLPSVAGR